MLPDLIRIVNQKPPRRHSLLKKFLLWALAGIALYAILGFFVLPPVVKNVLVKRLTESLRRQTEVRNVKINPFLLTVTIEGFLLKDRADGARFVSFDTLFLDLEVISLIKRGPVLREVRLIAPNLTIIRNEDFTYNFTDLLDAFTAQPAQERPARSTPLLFSLNNIQIERGAIEFDDRPKRGHHTVSDLTIGIPFISNLPSYVDVYVQPAFRAKLNGTPVALAGQTKPFIDSRETSLDINVSDFELPKYLEYLPAEIRFTMPSGSLDSKLSLAFTQYRNKPPALLLRGAVAVKHLSLRELNMAPLLEFPLLAVDIDAVDVFSKKAKLRSILLQTPKFYVRRDKSGTLNFRSMLPEKAANVSEGPRLETKPPAAALQIEVAEARLTDAEVRFIDDSTAKPFRAVLQALNIVLNHVSNIPEQPAAVEVSFQTNAGEMLRHTGTFTLEPLAAEGVLELQRVPLKRYAPYYRNQLLFDIEDGLVDMSTRYQYGQRADDKTRPPLPKVRLSGLAVIAKSVRLRRPGDKEEFLKVAAFAIKNGEVDLTKRSLVLGEVSTQKGTVTVRREKDGTVNLGKLMASSPQTGTKMAQKATPSAATKPSPAPWIVALKRFTLDRYAIVVEDQAPAEPATFIVDPLSLTAENLSTAKNTKGTMLLRATLNKSARLSAGGAIVLDPMSATLELDLKDLDLVALQPYFTDKIKLVVTSGSAMAHGTLAIAKNAENATVASFNGDASLTKFATIDKAHSEDFLKWQSLTVSGIQAGSDPLHVEIKDISLSDFYSRLIVNPDGTFNVQGLTEREAKPLADTKAQETQSAEAQQPAPLTAAPQAAPVAIRIDNVSLQGGNVSFSDHFIQPNYSAKLTQLGGRVTGLSSEESQKADVDLHGQLGAGTPLQIAGKINPLGKDLFVDLQIDFKDIDLSPLTPYAGKYAGYTIEKGKLSLTLKYLIEHRRLNAENKVILDEFTLGNKVDSPEATKLPVPLAVSLLKDRNGEINLEVPVTGSLDDPQFKIWGVVGMVLTNLLTKAATAPFALLGSLVGGGQELNYIDFEYGESHLGSAAQEKLQKLAKALVERPAVKLEVAGHVDLMKDQEVLRRRQFERKLKVQKLDEMLKKGVPAVPVNDIKIEPGEYSKYLTMAYKKETFPKPRNFLGLPKELPPAEMENLMLTHIEVTEDDLRQLALERAQEAKDYLLKSAKIEPGRISLNAAPAVLAEEKHSRVDFVIK